ncbi:MAG: hypothetical protein Q9N34_00670 [Aquificota bacterium]|nr:hypothetical protein [Aquificota bacterium]
MWDSEDKEGEDDDSIGDVISMTVERLEKDGFFEHYEIEDPNPSHPKSS